MDLKDRQYSNVIFHRIKLSKFSRICAHILCAVCSFRVKVSQSEILVERFFRSLANIFIIHYKKKLEPTKSNFQKIGYANQKLTFWLQITLSICLVCIAICRRLLFVALITTSLIVTLNKNNNIELFSL